MEVAEHGDQRGALQGDVRAHVRRQVPPTLTNVSADIALQGPALIAVLGDFVSVKSSIYIGPIPATLASLNAPASWSPPATIGPRSGANLETSLVSGPGGVYLGYAVPSATPGFADFVMRRAGGAGWGPPTVVAAKASKPDLHEDPSGRLHALWTDTAGLHYRYTTNAANTVWSAPQTIATGVSFGFPRLAVNADGKGWAVWGDGTNVQAVPLSRSPTRGTAARRGRRQAPGSAGPTTFACPRAACRRASASA